VNPASNKLLLLDPPLPDPVSWWPQTPAWYLLVGLLLLALLYGGLRRLSALRRNRYRSHALQKLAATHKQLQEPGDHRSALQQLASLLKQTAVTAMPGSQVESLSGEAWLLFLARTVDGDAVGRGLIEWPFWGAAQLQQLSPQQLDELVGQVRHWIEFHRVTD